MVITNRNEAILKGKAVKTYWEAYADDVVNSGQEEDSIGDNNFGYAWYFSVNLNLKDDDEIRDDLLNIGYELPEEYNDASEKELWVYAEKRTDGIVSVRIIPEDEVIEYFDEFASYYNKALDQAEENYREDEYNARQYYYN